MDTKSDEDELVNTSKDDSTSALVQPHDDSLSVADDLTERFSQQQMTLTKLRQMVLDEEQNRSKKLAENKLKLEKYTSQLARIRDRTHNKMRSSSSVASSSKDHSDADISMVASKAEEKPIEFTQSDINISSSSISDISLNLSPDPKAGKPKIPNRDATKILQQQIIQHKAAIAERAKNEKELEIALIKMQKQLEENQHQSAEIIQLGQTKPKYNINIHSKFITNEESLDSTKTIIELRNRILQLENNILDLQETCKEKDSVIKSKTEAITLMSADLSKKGKDTLDLLDDTKLQMQQMQENFANMEANMKLEKQSLIGELEVSKNKITYLEEANSILETERFKLSVENNNLEERLSVKEIEINRLNLELLDSVSKIEELISNQTSAEIKINEDDEKGIVEVAEMENLTKKIEDLEKINIVLKETNIQLESKVNEFEERSRADLIEMENLTKKIESIENSNISLKETNLELKCKVNEHEEKGTVEVAEMENLSKKIEDLEKLNSLLKETNTRLQECSAQKSNERKELELSKIKENKNKLETQDTNEIFKVLDEVANSLNVRIIDLEMCLVQKESELRKCQINDTIVEKESSENMEVDIDEMKNRIRLLEELTLSLKKSNIELQEKVTKSSKDKSKSPENSGSPKFEPKSQKSSQRGKGAQKNKNQQLKAEQEKQNEHNNFLIAIGNISYVLSILNNEVIEKESILKKKEWEINNLTLQDKITKEGQDVIEISAGTKEKLITEAIESDVIVGSSTEPETSTTEGTELDIISLRVQLDDALIKIEALNKEIADANKSMIKLKATNKTKIKQMQKSIDDYSKVSDSNSEVVRLQSEVSVLTQRITELEDDKGNLQLHLVDYDSDRVPESQLNAKLIEAERIAEERLKAIADLEQQKFELVQELHIVRQQFIALEDKVADLSALENEHVSCEIKLAQIEEQLDLIKAEAKKSSDSIAVLSSEKQELFVSIEVLNKDKSELSSKLECYMNENMELIDRLEKLSAEKVSSAESIEMVESLTTQEKMEIEQYQKGQYGMSNIHEDEMKYDDNFSKIATERHETMEKIENLQIINNTLSSKLDELMQEKKIIEDKLLMLESEKSAIYLEVKNSEEKLKSSHEKLEQFINENAILTRKLEEAVKENIREDVVKKEVVALQETAEVKIVKSDSKADKKFTKEILRLKNLLKHKETEIAELNTKLTNIVTAPLQVDQTDDIDKMKNQHLDSINSLHCTIQELENDKKLLQNELNSSNDFIANLKTQLATTESEFKTIYETILTGLKCHISTLHNAIKENETEISELILDFNQYYTYNDKINYLIQELLEKIKITHLVFINNKKEMKDVVNEKEKNCKIIVDLETQNCTKNEEINKLEVKLKNVSETSQKNDLIMKKLKELCKRLKNNENKLEEKIANLESEKESYCSRIGEIEALEDKLKNISSERSSEFQRIQESETVIETLKNELCNLQLNYDNAVSKFNETHEKLSVLEIETPKLRNEISELRIERENILSEILLFKTKNNACESEIESLHKKISQFESEKYSISNDLESYKNKSDSLQIQVDTLNVNLENCYLQIEKLNNENVSHATTIENIKQGISKTNILEEQLNSKEHEIKTLIEKLENIQISYNEFKSMQKAKVDEHVVFIENLEAEVEQYKNKNARLEEYVSKVEPLEVKLTNMLTQIQEKDAAYLRALEEKEKVEERATQMQTALIEQKGCLDTISIEHAHLMQMVNDLNKTISKLNEELRMTELKNKNLKADVLRMQDVESEKNTLSEEIVKLRIMVQEIDDKFKQKSKECEELEVMLQNQSENCEIQIKQFNDQYKRTQDELNLKSDQYHDLEEEFVSIKTEYESLIADKHEAVSFHGDHLDSNLKSQIDSLSAALKEKDAEIEHYQAHTLQLQMSMLGDNSQNVQDFNIASNNAEAQSKRIEELENVIKNFEQYMREEQFKISNLLSEKDVLITKLENEIQMLKQQVERPSIKEDIIVQKCSQYFASQPKQQDNIDFIKSIEDQIIPSDSLGNVNIDDQNLRMIRAFQHDPPVPVKETDIPATSSSVPIVEEEIKPKTAFICFDDSAENALKINELQAQINNLTDEKAKLIVELQQSQMKTKKALIKLKEFKMINDKLKAVQSKSSKHQSVDILDSAIEEELTSQVKALEEKMKEMKTAFNKEKLEKDGLLKRIDVLTSANERLINMKEKQDVELQMSISKNANLEKKMEMLQWDSDFGTDENWESKSVKDVASNIEEASNAKTIEELNKKINILQDDNEELQTIIEQQSNTVKDFTEKQKDLLSELSAIKDENEFMKTTMEDNLSKLQSTNFELELVNKSILDLDAIRCENISLKEKYESIVRDYEDFSVKYANIIVERDNLKTKHDQIQVMIGDLIRDHEEYLQLEDHKRVMKEDITELDAEMGIKKLKQDLNNMRKEKDQIKEDLDKKLNEMLLYETKLTEISDKYENIQENINDYEQQILKLTGQLEEKSQGANNKDWESRIDEVTKKLDKTLNEKNEAIRQRDENKLLYEKQFSDLDNAYKQKEFELTNQLNEKCHAFDSKDIELKLEETMTNLKEVINERNEAIKERDNLKELHEKQLSDLENSYTHQMFMLTNQLNEKSCDLSNKDIMSLNEVETKLKEAIKERDECREYYENIIGIESEKLQQALKEYDNLRNIIVQKEERILVMTEDYNKIMQESESIKEILQSKDEELQKYYNLEALYKNKFNEYNVILQAKDVEIQKKFEEFNITNERISTTNVELLGKIEEIRGEYDLLVKQLSEMEEKFSDMSHEKDAESANLRLRFNAERMAFEGTISESAAKVSFLENQLEIKIEECRSLNSKLEEAAILVDEEAAQMSEMRSALEAQEIEIVSLKENLAEQIKANEKMHRHYTKSERHVSFSEDTKPGDDFQQTESTIEKTDNTEKSPPRADLDLAMYMLHQRDVRCEELTVELTHLLEERDTLQLKLSNTLRLNEELRMKYSNLESDDICNVQHNQALLQSPSTSTAELNVNKTTLEKNEESLENKISQLHNVNHLRDVRVKDERETRQKQMELLQRDIQHLPPEAVAQLREAHYTLSRDTQSASTVLLNWLWGKTTPKVLHM